MNLISWLSGKKTTERKTASSATIVYGYPLFNVREKCSKIDWHVQAMRLSMEGIVSVSLEQHGTMQIEQMSMTIEQAGAIGLINWSALAPFLNERKTALIED